jgi:hypothetical protein
MPGATRRFTFPASGERDYFMAVPFSGTSRNVAPLPNCAK